MVQDHLSNQFLPVNKKLPSLISSFIHNIFDVNEHEHDSVACVSYFFFFYFAPVLST